MKDFSYITNSHPAFIENLYRDFINNPDSVDPEMRKFFEGFDFAFSEDTVMLPPGQFIVLARNPDAFSARYPPRARMF